MPVIVAPDVASFFRGIEYCTHPPPKMHGWKFIIANWHPRTGVDVVTRVAVLVCVNVGVAVYVAVSVGVLVGVSVGVLVGVSVGV